MQFLVLSVQFLKEPTYVYESQSYYDPEKKQSRSKRKLIGKIDKATGEIVPTGRRGPGKKAGQTDSTDSGAGNSEAVLEERLEAQEKLLKGDIHKPEFSADYQHAFQQIKDWKAEIERNKEGFLRCLDCIRTPLEHNEVFFKYVIVMGRNAEKSEAGRKLIARECENYKDSLSIITYDRLLSDYERERRSLSESIVLTIDESGIANINLLPEGEISTTMFSWVNRDHLKISKDQIERLKKQDYEMDSWLAGKLLDHNEKYTAKGLAEKLPDGNLMKAVLKSD